MRKFRAVVGAPFVLRSVIPGSEIFPCRYCGIELWLSPNSQRLVADGADVVCMDDALTRMDSETEVMDSREGVRRLLDGQACGGCEPGDLVAGSQHSTPALAEGVLW